MRAQATAASQPACPAPTIAMSKFSVNCTRSLFYRPEKKIFTTETQSHREGLLAFYICEDGLLPIVRGEIPVAGAGFVVVAAGAVSDGWVAPVTHAHLQQGSAGDFYLGLYRAAFEMAGRESGAGGCAPEMPDSVGILADAEDYGAAVFMYIRGGWDLGAEPGVTAVKASANVAAIVIQDEGFSIYGAGELGAGDFDLRIFISWDTGVGDGDAPQRCRSEIRRLGDGIDVSGFVADFIRDAGVSLGEREEWNKEQQDSAE